MTGEGTIAPPDDVEVLTVEGEAVLRSGPSRGPALLAVGFLLAAALVTAAAGDVLGEIVPVLGRNADTDAVAAAASAESENPGRYGLYQQREVAEPGGDVDGEAQASSSLPPLPVGLPDAPFDPSVSQASHDGSIVAYMASGGGAVLRVRTGAGEELSAVAVDGGFELRTLSTDGSQAALWRLVDGRSEIAVVNTIIGEINGVLAFDGLVEPEAFSADGRVLFVGDSGASDEPGQHGIRPLELGTGKLGGMLGPTKAPVEKDVSGIGGRPVWGPGGTRLYTLYVNGDVNGDVSGGDQIGEDQGGAGFVHVLDLAEEWAFALELPDVFGEAGLSSVSLAVSDSGEIVVLDTEAAQIAIASADDLEVTSTGALPDDVLALLISGQRSGAVHVAATADHLLVATGRRAYWLEASSLELVGAPVELAGEVVGVTSGARPLVWFGSGRPPLELSAPG